MEPRPQELRILVKIHGIAEIRVSFEELNCVDLIRMRSRVSQDKKPITDVDHVDQPIADDRVAPEYDLVWTAA
jgi:hypothetical protein